MTRILPPGLNEQQFDTALQRFRDVVGDKWVLSDAADLAAFQDPYPVGAEPNYLPSAVVSPASTEQVREIVLIANEFGIPLQPVSTGKTMDTAGRRRDSPARSSSRPATE